MLIDLTELYEKQEHLNNLILEKHQLTRDSILQETKLATLVELAELANEVRSFKYWSYKGMNDRSIVLEEYVDGIHFALTIGIILNLPKKIDIPTISITNDRKILTKHFNDLFNLLNRVEFTDESQNVENAKKYLAAYLAFGYTIGFDFKEIVNAYNAKYEINLKRQRENY
ncbi:MAG: dUTP diphosphatase [Mycoplasmataceae bacterium]|nr:dUTP diphosphatase [Mycoplasmataceae bacterium]